MKWIDANKKTPKLWQTVLVRRQFRRGFEKQHTVRYHVAVYSKLPGARKRAYHCSLHVGNGLQEAWFNRDVTHWCEIEEPNDAEKVDQATAEQQSTRLWLVPKGIGTNGPAGNCRFYDASPS